jgi:glutathione synthase/RimK-type ligase-like ATP-grasp enzyme
MNSEVVEQCEGHQSLIGLVTLMRMTISGADMGSLGVQLIARAGTDPRTADANALMDLSTILQLRGDRELGLTIQRQALAIQQVYSPPCGLADRRRAAVRLLAIMGEGDLMSNSPIEFLLEEADVSLDIVYVTNELDLPEILPEHDVLFVAIAESEQNIPLLNKIHMVIESWPRPVINSPSRIAALSRDNCYAQLRSVPGLEVPATVRVSRKSLEEIAQGELPMASVLDDGDFPVIVRPVDSHAGQGLEKINDADEIAGYLSGMGNDEFYVSRFVDYRGTDGLFRKYRIMLIKGRPFICHMGISEHWMIHYANAGMADSEKKRDEEARFMSDFDVSFAVKHAGAFKEIQERLGLDYLGIDCAETQDGCLLIFEVDSCMIVHALDPVDVYPYKQPQMRRLFEAFCQMLLSAMQQA